MKPGESVQEYKLGFNAKWITKVINATPNGVGGYQYVIDRRFVPVNEISVPYGLDHITDGEVARKILHASTAVNLLQAYNGINLDLSSLAIDGNTFAKRFFITQDERAAGATTTSDVLDGDSVLVLCPMV